MRKKYIVIAPYAKRLRNGKENPKNYPHWRELVHLMSKTHDIIQIGIDGEDRIPGVAETKFGIKLKEIEELIQYCDTWVSVDSFLQHMVNCTPLKKPGVVLWARSDWRIFGYPQNLNIIKDEKYLLQFPFSIWEDVPYDPDAYMPACEIYEIMRLATNLFPDNT